MTQLTNTPYEALEVGQKATYSKTVGEKDIQLFAAMSGDQGSLQSLAIPKVGESIKLDKLIK